jgi:hypothetical protein
MELKSQANKKNLNEGMGKTGSMALSPGTMKMNSSNQKQIIRIP